MTSYGQIAYDAYCQASGSKSLVTGQTLPEWDDLPPAIRAAWVEAAIAVHRSIAQALSEPRDQVVAHSHCEGE